MHRVTDGCSVETQVLIPDEAFSIAGDWLRGPDDEKFPQSIELAQFDPLYLFACDLLWRKQEDATAAWELIHGLKSCDEATRLVVTTLLSKRKPARETGVAQARRIQSSPRCGP